jgi:hypothetical protein
VNVLCQKNVIQRSCVYAVVVTKISGVDVGTSSVETDKHGSDLSKPQVKLVYVFIYGWDSEEISSEHWHQATSV